MKVEIDLNDYKKELRNFNHFKNGFLEGKIELEIPKPYKILWEGNLIHTSSPIEIENINNFSFLEFLFKFPTAHKSVKSSVDFILENNYVGYDGFNLYDAINSNGFDLYEGRLNITPNVENSNFTLTFFRSTSVNKGNNATTFTKNETSNDPYLYSVIGIY